LPSKVKHLNIFDISTGYKFMEFGIWVANDIIWEGEGNMTFDELIERKEQYIIDPYRTWDEWDIRADRAEMEDCPLDVLQWYLALILRNV
jgi:hypothetical protein